MFQKLIDGLRWVVSKILPKKSVEETLDVKIVINKKMESAIDLWSLMYQDQSPWLDKDDPESLNLASSIASELARLTTLELESEITGGDRADYLNEQYRKIINNLKIQVEFACAKGGLVFKPYVDGRNIAVDYVHAGEFFPIRFDSNGNITSCVFPQRIYKGDTVYTRLEFHELTDSGYIVRNTAYKNKADSNDLGKQIKLTEVEEWKSIEELVAINTDRPLFAYFRIPLANHIDSQSPLGVSVYSRATDLIKKADEQWSRILWEYEGSELAIDAAADLFTINNEIPKGKERLYRKIDTEKEDFFKAWAPEIRDEPLFHGLNQILRRIEFVCGVAYGTISDVQEQDKTATEVKASKQRSYSTVSDIQDNLEKALMDLIIVMDIYATLYNLAPAGEYEASFEWDDSLVMDTDVENALMLQEVAAGLIKPELYLMRRYGVTEEQARDMLPSVNEPDEPPDGLE